MRTLTKTEIKNVTGGLTYEEYLEMGLPEDLARQLAAEDAGGSAYTGATEYTPASPEGIEGVRGTGSRIPR